MTSYRIAPSLMCCDLMNVERTVRELDAAGVDMYHLDVFDGSFVENFQLGFGFTEQLRAITQTPIEVHLYANEPERFIESFARLGADMLTLQYEALADPRTALEQIHQAGMQASLGILPQTEVAEVESLLPLCDYLCLLTVDPRASSWDFLPNSYERIRMLHTLVEQSGRNIPIAVDGNIGAHTIPGCLEAGAQCFVCGTTSVFSKGNSLTYNVQAVRELLN